MAVGVDYSSGRLTPTAIAAANFQAAFLYVDDPNESFGTKHTDPADYAAFVNAGMPAYLIFENEADDFAGGFIQGVIDATRALAGSNWIGYAGVIFASVDTNPDMTAIQLAEAQEYLLGFQHVLGLARVGVYGFSDVITMAQKNNLAIAFWQCGDAPAAGSGVHVWQRNDGQFYIDKICCDIDEILLPIPDGDVLTPEQNAMLTACYQYVSGSAEVVPQGTPWPGWQTWPGGSGTPLTATDYLRQNNVDVETLKTEVAAIKTTLDSLSVGQNGDLGNLSDADVSRIATAVTEMLSSKLGAS